jgi:nucleotide-binding universal stress UspA family protein
MPASKSSPVFNNPSTESDLKPLRPLSERSSIGLKKILMPIDFSANSEKALDYGLRLAQLTQASVILLHVYELPEFSGLLPEPSSWQIDYPEIKKSFDAAIETAKERLAKMAHRVREEEIEVRTQICQGTPYEEIVKVAKAEEVELVVIATHGYTGFKHFLLGSTAERVVRAAPCPVLVVREKERDFLL